MKPTPMKLKIGATLGVAFAAVLFEVGSTFGEALPGLVPAPGESKAVDSSALADKKYEEMLGKMQAAVEEIAQLYGNPLFLQVFTNDEGRASELKLRLRADRTSAQLRKELKDLEKQRSDLLGDIELRKRESARLSEKLVHQRAALDALAAVVEQAKNAVEDTPR